MANSAARRVRVRPPTHRRERHSSYSGKRSNRLHSPRPLGACGRNPTRRHAVTTKKRSRCGTSSTNARARAMSNRSAAPGHVSICRASDARSARGVASARSRRVSRSRVPEGIEAATGESFHPDREVEAARTAAEVTPASLVRLFELRAVSYISKFLLAALSHVNCLTISLSIGSRGAADACTTARAMLSGSSGEQ